MTKTRNIFIINKSFDIYSGQTERMQSGIWSYQTLHSEGIRRQLQNKKLHHTNIPTRRLCAEFVSL